MSRQGIRCSACQAALAHRHHTGRIRIVAGVRVDILADRRVLVTCSCGATRIVEVTKQAA